MENIINHWVMLIKSTMRYQLTKMKMANKDMEKMIMKILTKGHYFTMLLEMKTSSTLTIHSINFPEKN